VALIRRPKGDPMELLHLTWPEARDAIRSAGIALLPVGAVEQHGPHLPLGTDLFIARWITDRAIESRRWIRLPEIAVGASEEHRQFWGTLWVSPDRLRDQSEALADAAASHGIRRIVFVNGHGGNAGPLADAARRLRHRDIHAYVYNWWISIRDLLSSLFPDPTAHAGSIETSAMLAIDPDAVRFDRIREADPAREWGVRVEGVEVASDAIEFTASGNVGDPALADPDAGRRILDEAAGRLVRFGDWLSDRPDRALRPRPHLP